VVKRKMKNIFNLRREGLEKQSVGLVVLDANRLNRSFDSFLLLVGSVLVVEKQCLNS